MSMSSSAVLQQQQRTEAMATAPSLDTAEHGTFRLSDLPPLPKPNLSEMRSQALCGNLLVLSLITIFCGLTNAIALWGPSAHRRARHRNADGRAALGAPIGDRNRRAKGGHDVAGCEFQAPPLRAGRQARELRDAVLGPLPLRAGQGAALDAHDAEREAQRAAKAPRTAPTPAREAPARLQRLREVAAAKGGVWGGLRNNVGRIADVNFFAGRDSQKYLLGAD